MGRLEPSVEEAYSIMERKGCWCLKGDTKLMERKGLNMQGRREQVPAEELADAKNDPHGE